MSNTEAFRARRAELATELDAVDGPKSLLAVQLKLVEEIKAVEAQAFRNRLSPEREHLNLMRIFGDTVAWKTLHSHTIRQLAKHPGKPPALSSQQGLEFVLQCAALAAETGHAVRICDVTNVLKISDLVIGDYERPMLIECGPDGGKVNGRKARQLERMEVVSSILRDGRGFVPGTEVPFMVLDVSVAAEHSWGLVEAAVSGALTDGSGLAQADGDLVWAIRSDAIDGDRLPGVDEATKLAADFEDPIVATVSSRLDDPSAAFPPPLAYPLPLKLQLALLERDVRLIHIIDLARFLRVKLEGASVTRIRRDHRGNLLQPPLIVETTACVAAGSSRHIEDVLYGFVSIDSSVKSLLAATVATSEEDLASGPAVDSLSAGPLRNLAIEMTAA